MTTDPLAWVRAEMDAAEKEALAATLGPWETEGDDPTDDTVYSVCEDPDLVGQQVAFTRGPRSYESMVHIARHHPTAVLRRIKAERKMLDECEAAYHWDNWGASSLADAVVRGIAEGWGWTEEEATRRRRKPAAPPRPDHTQIAVLEWEIFGIEPTPGTMAEAAVGMKRLGELLRASQPRRVQGRRGGHASTDATVHDLPSLLVWLMPTADGTPTD